MLAKYHYAVLIHEQAKKYGTKPVITFRHFGSLEWKTVSWNQFSMRVKQVSNALIKLRTEITRENCRIRTELYTVSLYRFWCLWCSCNHNSILCIKF